MIIRHLSAFAGVLFALSSIAQEAQSPTAAQDNPAPFEMAILRAPEPTDYTMQNKMVVGGLIHFFRNKSLGSNLSLDMMRQKPRLAEMINQEVASQLNAKGITVSDSPSVAINPEKPWKMDYQTLGKHDKPVLFIYVESIGVKSQTTESSYKPFAYVVYCLVTHKRSRDCTSFGRATFGDGEEQDYEDSWIVGNLREEQWRSANEVYENLPEVTQAYRRALPRMAGWLANAAIDYLGSEDYKNLKAK